MQVRFLNTELKPAVVVPQYASAYNGIHNNTSPLELFLKVVTEAKIVRRRKAALFYFKYDKNRYY